MEHNIDIKALYDLTTQNNQTRTVMGSVLYHNYLCDELNRPSLKEYKKVEGCWWDVIVQGKKIWACYAETAELAIKKRWDDLTNLGHTDMTKLSAKESDFNNQFKTVTIN